MKQDRRTLKELLVTELPPGFTRSLHARMEQIYPETYASVFNDPDLGEEQANYLLGYYRRANAETILMRTAAEHGLFVKTIQPDSGGCKCIYIASGMFGFTMCHVTTAGGFPQFSDTREQSAKINEYVAQGDLFIQEDPNGNQKKIYGIFVHTEQPGNKDSFKSLHIGFPTPEFDDWLEEPIDVRDIVDIQERRFRKEKDLHEQIQNPKPVWKKNNKKVKSGDDK